MKITPFVLFSTAFAVLTVSHSQSLEFKKFSVSPNQRERVTGILCSSAKSCLIGTDVFGSNGGLYASNGTSITSRLYSNPDQRVNFFGFSKVGNLTFAHTNKANAFFHAIGASAPICFLACK